MHFQEAHANSKPHHHYNISFVRLRDINHERDILRLAHTDCVAQSQRGATIPSKRQTLEHIVHDWRPPSNRPKRECSIPRSTAWPHRDGSHAPPPVLPPDHDHSAHGVDLCHVLSLFSTSPRSHTASGAWQQFSLPAGTLPCLRRLVQVLRVGVNYFSRYVWWSCHLYTTPRPRY